MPQEELFTSKSLRTLGGGATMCFLVSSILPGLLGIEATQIRGYLSFGIALLIVAFQLFENKKIKRKPSIYLLALLNAILIATTSMGLNHGYASIDKSSTTKDSANVNLKESSLIPFVSSDIWFPPAKLVNEIEAKDDTLKLERADYKSLSKTDSNRTIFLEGILDSNKSNAPIIKERKEEAKKLYKRAYEHLKNNNFIEAMDNFRKTEEIYPTYANAFEIFNYLRKNQDKFETQQDVLKKFISKNYSWSAPILLDSEPK